MHVYEIYHAFADNLAANFSRELADYIIYIIDVSGGDKIPRKGGPGITQADLLVCFNSCHHFFLVSIVCLFFLCYLYALLTALSSQAFIIINFIFFFVLQD